MELYNEKNNQYYSNVRNDVIGFLDEHSIEPSSLLEIGCGDGATLEALKAHKEIEYTCGADQFEFDDERKIDSFKKIDLNGDFSFDRKFDAVLALDVLEHLVDPWAVIDKLGHYLREDGYFVVSLPNISEFRTMQKIFISGDFGYQEQGILDRTHLRFFCFKNMIDLFPGYKMVDYTCDFAWQEGARRRLMFNRITFGLFERFLTKQYILLFQKN